MPVARRPTKQPAKGAPAPKAAARKKASQRTREVPASSNDKEADKLAVGDEVSHPMFGEGTVTEVNADKLTIEFADRVIRQIVDYYVKNSK
jgi:hypothetical protein